MDGWPCGQHKAWSHARGVKARKLVNYFRVDLYASQMRFQHRGPSLPREGFVEGEVGEDGMGGWDGRMEGEFSIVQIARTGINMCGLGLQDLPKYSPSTTCQD